VQNSALLRLVPVWVPEQVRLQAQRQVLLPVPKLRLGPLSVSACSLEQQGRLYIPSH